jgi:hypothetical protein
MARPKKEIPDIAGNKTEILLVIKTALNAVQDAKRVRAAANADIASARAKVEAVGIPKNTFDAALRYLETDESKRKNVDDGYALCREAFGLPVQFELGLAAADEDETKGKGRRRAANGEGAQAAST